MAHTPPPLRLTKSYTRVSAKTGMPQRVTQYPTPHPGHLNPSASVNGKLPQVQAPWATIKTGATVDFGGEPWKVLADSVNNKAGAPNKTGTMSTGKGVRTAGPQKTSSKGKGMNTKGGVSSTRNPKTGGDAMITHVLENLWTGKRVQISLNSAFKVWVY